MMKKLLVLMLVLGLASTAGAYTVTTDGLVMEVFGGAGETVAGEYIFSGTTISIAWPQGTGMPIIHTTVGNLGDNDNTAGDLGIVSVADIGSAIIAQVFAMVSTDPVDSIDAGLWFTIDIADVSTAGWTVGGLVDTLDLYDFYAEPIGTIDVTSSVPEPMTIALLGLGGLFLLRRRK